MPYAATLPLAIASRTWSAELRRSVVVWRRGTDELSTGRVLVGTRETPTCLIVRCSDVHVVRSWRSVVGR
jgi:hypothetical protein